MIDLKAIGKAIQTERKERGYTQASLSQATQIRQATISRLEAGDTNIGLDNLAKICKFLGIAFRVEDGKLDFYTKR